MKPAVQPVPAKFTTNQVQKIAGVTLRQLQWWDEQGLVCPVHDGHNRVYSETDAIHVCLVAALQRKGLSHKVIRAELQSTMVERLAGLTGEYFILGTKAGLTLVLGRDQVVDRIVEARQAALLVSVSELLNRVRSRAETHKNGKKR
jgi:DNA-binding transcriptional MerR regulator